MAEEGSAGVPEASTGFERRLETLQLRVNTAALALHERSIRPTVARIRAALGGGSPNELAPALRHWKDEVLPTLTGGGSAGSGPPIPPLIADLAHELWTRATAAAAVELKGGQAARQAISRTEEAQLLRDQLNSLRDQLQRESLAYGELRAQGARHEAIAREALNRVRDAEIRERELLHELGQAQQRCAELIATVEQIESRTTAAPKRPARPRKRSPTTQHATKPKVRPTAPKRNPTKATRRLLRLRSRRPPKRRR